MSTSQRGIDLIIAVDDKLDGPSAQTMSGQEKRNRLRQRIELVCRSVSGLCVPITHRPVQIKLNSAARALGTKCIELADGYDVDVFLDWKLPLEVLDTLYADIRGITDYSNIKRLTFRVENQVEFLSGRGSDPGACAMMPHTKFLPVGPVTDLSPSYYMERMELRGGREEAMRNFGFDVMQFEGYVTEVICSPKDIASFPHGFWHTHSPVTPAVRPAGLKGNEANSANAFDVAKAIAAGSTGLVIGSPIMGAEDVRGAVELVLEQMNDALCHPSPPI